MKAFKILDKSVLPSEAKILGTLSKQSESIDVCFMLDCTGSMSSYLEKTKKMILYLQKKITQEFNGVSLRFSFVRYTDFDISESQRYSLLNWTSNTTEFQNFIEPIKCMGGGANGGEDVFGGLKKALTELNWNRKNTNILIHFADESCHGKQFSPDRNPEYPNGDPNGITLDFLMTKIRDLKIKYWFGEIEAYWTKKMITEFNKKLDEIKCPRKIITFDAHNTNDIEETVLNCIISSVSDYILEWAKANLWQVGEQISMYVYISEKKQGVLSKIKDPLIQVQTNNEEYFHDIHEYIKIEQCSEGKIYLELDIPTKSTANIENLPSTLILSLQDRDGREYDSIVLAITADMFLDHLFETQSNNKADILLFGLAGSSKSSFINSAITAMNDVTTPIQKAVAGGHEKRVTTVLKSWSLPRLKDKKVCNYRLWDTWGLERDNYKEKCHHFEKIVLGEASTGWEMEKALKEEEEDKIFEEKNLDPKKKKSLVIFIVEAGSFLGDPDNDPLLENLRNYVSKTTTLGIHSIVALSKADLVGYDIEEENNSNFEKFRTKAANFFKLGKSRVFPLITYANIKEKNFQIDKLVLDILLNAFHFSKAPLDLHSIQEQKNTNNSNNNNNDDDDDDLFNQ